jgi:hypothetical protein
MLDGQIGVSHYRREGQFWGLRVHGRSQGMSCFRVCVHVHHCDMNHDLCSVCVCVCVCVCVHGCVYVRVCRCAHAGMCASAGGHISVCESATVGAHRFQ